MLSAFPFYQTALVYLLQIAIAAAIGVLVAFTLLRRRRGLRTTWIIAVTALALAGDALVDGRYFSWQCERAEAQATWRKVRAPGYACALRECESAVLELFGQAGAQKGFDYIEVIATGADLRWRPDIPRLWSSPGVYRVALGQRGDEACIPEHRLAGLPAPFRDGLAAGFKRIQRANACLTFEPIPQAQSRYIKTDKINTLVDVWMGTFRDYTNVMDRTTGEVLFLIPGYLFEGSLLRRTVYSLFGAPPAKERCAVTRPTAADVPVIQPE